MLQIDPGSWSGQHFRWMSQLSYEWNWDEAERTFQERCARQADVPWVAALYLRAVGRFDEARREHARSDQFNQTNAYLLNHTAAAAYVERDYRRAIELGERIQALYPTINGGFDWLFHAHYQLGLFH